MNKEMWYQDHVKVKAIILGDRGVGKTYFLKSMCNKQIKQQDLDNAGITYDILNAEYLNYFKYRFQFWDRSGLQKLVNVNRVFYKDISAIILAYSVDDRSSFQNIQKWMKDIEIYSNIGICKILIGMKIDLEDRKVSKQQGIALSNKLNAKFIQLSSKSRKNIEESLEIIIQMVHQQYESIRMQKYAEQMKFEQKY